MSELFSGETLQKVWAGRKDFWIPENSDQYNNNKHVHYFLFFFISSLLKKILKIYKGESSFSDLLMCYSPSTEERVESWRSKDTDYRYFFSFLCLLICRLVECWNSVGDKLNKSDKREMKAIILMISLTE
jgi:hypothetical protein